jgi:hypothetical protein
MVRPPICCLYHAYISNSKLLQGLFGQQPVYISENIILGASSDCDISVNIPAPASHHQLPPHIQFVRKIMTYEDVTLFPFPGLLVKKAW